MGDAATSPPYVVAPQLPGRTSQWTEPAIQAAVLALLDRMAATYRIDTDRVYLTGLSRGGRGAVEFLSNQPDRFAGSLLAAARAEDDDVSQVPAFVKVPLWLTHAIDDPVVPYQGSVDIANTLEAAGARVTRGTWAGDNSAGRAQDQAAEAAARRLLAQARAARSHTLFTTTRPERSRSTPTSPGGRCTRPASCSTGCSRRTGPGVRARDASDRGRGVGA